MGVGSQRRQIEENRLYAKKDSSQFHTLNQLDQWKRIRENCPDLILFSNLGISQVIALTLSEIHELNKSIQANAMVIHLNALQEVLQKEGTPLFRGALEKIREISKELKIPLILKETGCGFSERTLEKIKNIPFAALDVSGLGGTHWGRIEGARNSEGSLLQNASETFANWGVSTVQSVLNAKKYLSHQEIWASGGVRSGLDAAKLLTLGADRVGFAQPALSAVLRGEDSLSLWMEQIEYELKIAFFCMGIKNLNQLKESQGLWTTMKNY